MVLLLQNIGVINILPVIRKFILPRTFYTFFLLLFAQFSNAQTDTVPPNKLDSLLSRPKGIFGQLTQSLLTDLDTAVEQNLQRNDQPFLKYENRVIRNIFIQSLEFGTLTKDTVRRLDKRLARTANKIHYKTRPWAVRNNLFFYEHDKLSPYLLANNERFLRDLPYIREARILVWPVRGGTDSVDVIVVTKDVLSIGGSIALRNSKSATMEIKEDNLMGWGDKLAFQGLYHTERRKPFGYGMEYIKRNIGGSFIDARAGLSNFNKTFNNRKREETIGFIQFIKPLVNPYMLWTYAFIAEKHYSDNMFNSDSVFKSDLKYHYNIYDAWAGLNLSTRMIANENEFHRLRYLLSARMVDQKFSEKPTLYNNKYYYPYADLFAVLGAISIFRLNYYKTQFIYGFGRNEDLPVGLDASFTAGWTNKAGRERPYAGVNLQHYYFTKQQSYFKYSLSAGSYLHKKKPEDISLLANIDFFSPLLRFGKKWKQRSFLNASFGKQFNSILDEPFLLESFYGIPYFKNNSLGGNLRATVRAESVFFSPWSIVYFKFAPFIYGSATAFKLNEEGSKSKIYPAFGGGLRSRNESLIFGTMELRVVYFPTPDLYNHRYFIQFNSNLRFKYIQNFIRRPEFVSVN